MRKLCGRGAAVRRVPVVSLGTILDRWLPDRTIEFLRVDAQGYDLRVILSAPPRALARVRALELEMTSSDLKLPYAGADSCPEVVGNLSNPNPNPNPMQPQPQPEDQPESESEPGRGQPVPPRLPAEAQGRPVLRRCVRG